MQRFLIITVNGALLALLLIGLPAATRERWGDVQLSSASTGRLLNAPGACRSFVLFSQFHRAGWATGADVPLDLAKVTAIRVGWGGYFGAGGEKIQFTAQPPQRFACGLKTP